MPNLSSEYILQQLQSNNIKTFKASTTYSDILLDSTSDDSFPNLLSLLKELNVNHVFYNILYLEEDEIDVNLITTSMLLRKGINQYNRHIVESKINDFNDTQLSLRKHVGEEQKIHLFFPVNGILYGFIIFNHDLIPNDPDEFIEDLLIEHGEILDEVEEEESSKKEIEKQEKFQWLADELSKSDNFKKCTNKNLRRDFAYGVIRERKDFYDGAYIAVSEIVDVVERVWRDYKADLDLLKEKFKKGGE